MKRCDEEKWKQEGSTSVFLVMILASMISLTLAFVSVSLRTSAIGYSDAVLGVAGRSVMSEYDVHLKDEYGIMAFRGFGPEIAKRVEYFASYTFDRNKHLDLQEVRANSAGLSLADTDAFEKEVVRCAKFAIARGIISDGGEEEEAEGGGTATERPEGGRTLRNKAVIDSLPSGGHPGNGSLFEKVKSVLSHPADAFKSGSTNYLVNRYILLMFGNAQTGAVRDSFFTDEAEYIIEGRMSDDANYRAFKRDLTEVRNAANLVYIWMDPDMRAKVTAVAEAATPGPWSALTAAAVSEAWALAEAMNDVKLLEHGKKVPVVKTEATWAVDIESLFNKENIEAGYIDTDPQNGLTYTGYLQLFLFLEERSMKLQRMMDLIQINIQGKYDREFLIMEHNLGFWFGAKIDGRQYAYEEKY